MLLKIVGLDNTMTLPPRNVSIVLRVSNAAFQQKLYAHSVQFMIRILLSVSSVQMSTFVFILQVVPYNLLIAGVMEKTLPWQPSWIYLSMQIDYQPPTISGA